MLLERLVNQMKNNFRKIVAFVFLFSTATTIPVLRLTQLAYRRYMQRIADPANTIPTVPDLVATGISMSTFIYIWTLHYSNQQNAQTQISSIENRDEQ